VVPAFNESDVQHQASRTISTFAVEPGCNPATTRERFGVDDAVNTGQMSPGLMPAAQPGSFEDSLTSTRHIR
jgi:hypothetical protein